MMGNHELCEEIFVRRKKTGEKHADRTRYRNRRRKNMSSILTWADGGRKPENLDGNDTSAESEQSSQGSAWGMLQQERVLQGVRRPARPVLHTPCHAGME